MLFFPRIDNEKPFNLLDVQAFKANQRGEITPTQKKQALATISWAGIIFITLLIILIGSAYVIVFAPVIFTLKAYNLLKIQSIMPFLGSIFLIFLLLVSISIFRKARKTIKIWRDIAKRAIHQGQGQIVHTEKGYIFEMDGNNLHLNANLNNGLLPGITYQVFYLEKSRFLLSAKMAQAPNPTLAQTVLNDILASANGFSTEDLLANQNGQITPTQYCRLIPNTLAGVGLLLLALLFIPPIIAYTLNAQPSSIIFWIIIAFLSIFPITGIVLLLKSLLDVASPKPQQVQGPVYKGQHLVQRGRTTYLEYDYRVNGKRFTVSYRAYTALIDGLQYRIYYLGHSKKLISIETVLVPYTDIHLDQP